jgi:hypothetical protein
MSLDQTRETLLAYAENDMQQWITAQTNLAHAHAAFQHVAAALPADRRDQAGVCGQWTPRQVAAHLAGWDREAARALQALLAGAPEDLVADTRLDPGCMKPYSSFVDNCATCDSTQTSNLPRLLVFYGSRA